MALRNKPIFAVMQGQARPTASLSEGLAEDETATPSAQATLQWQRSNSDLYSILYLATVGAACSLVRRHVGKTQEDGAGDGQAAWNALTSKYDGCTKEARRACHEKLTTLKMEDKQDPEDFFFKMDDLRQRLAEMGEVVSDERYEDIILQGITNDYDCVREASYRERDFDIERIQFMMRNLHTDSLSRAPSSTEVAGRAVAMQATADLDKVTCFHCNQFGHRKQNCTAWKLEKKQGGKWKSTTAGDGKSK